MITKEDLQKNYEKFSNSELMGIIDRKSEYTEIAVAVATEELAKRNISEEEIKKYEKKTAVEYTVKVEKNFIDDLTVFQKAMYFIFWPPLFTIAFKNNYKRDGYILKLKQARFFSLIGFFSFIAVGIISSAVNMNTIVSLLFLAILFFITIQYDQIIRRKKRLEISAQKLEDKVA